MEKIYSKKVVVIIFVFYFLLGIGLNYYWKEDIYFKNTTDFFSLFCSFLSLLLISSTKEEIVKFGKKNKFLVLVNQINKILAKNDPICSECYFELLAEIQSISPSKALGDEKIHVGEGEEKKILKLSDLESKICDLIYVYNQDSELKQKRMSEIPDFKMALYIFKAKIENDLMETSNNEEGNVRTRE